MSDLMNSLNRLQRAGDNGSKATKKLHEAASTVADEICKSVYAARAVGEKLPRGYRVVNVRSNVGDNDFLTLDSGKKNLRAGDSEFGYDEFIDNHTFWIDGTGSYMHGDFHCMIPDQEREGSLRFAKDIAEGLLDEIASFLEARETEAEKMSVILCKTN